MAREKKEIALEKLATTLSVKDLYSLYKGLRPVVDEGDEHSRYMDLWFDWGVVNVGVKADLIGQDEIEHFIKKLETADLMPGAKCQVLASWFALATSSGETIDRERVALIWLANLGKLNKIPDQLYYWQNYLSLAAPENAREIAAWLEAGVLNYLPASVDGLKDLPDDEASRFNYASQLVITARSQNIELNRLDRYLLGLVEKAKTEEISGGITVNLLTHARSSLQTEGWKRQIADKARAAALRMPSGILARDGILEDLVEYYVDLGEVQTAKECLERIDIDVCRRSAARELIALSLKTGQDLLSFKEVEKGIHYKKLFWRDWVNTWFMQAFFLTAKGSGVYLDRPEAIAAVQGGVVDLEMPLLAEILAKPEIAARAPRMLMVFRERLKTLVKKARSPFGRNQDKVIETLVEAKLGGLI